MRSAIRLGGGTVILLGIWACAGTPGPGQPDYPFNLSGAYAGEMAVEGQYFSVGMDVQTVQGGDLAGTYEVTSPVSMSGDVTGSVQADTVRFSLNYMNPMDGCGGTVDGTGTIEEGGGAFSGRMRVNDSCGGYLSGTFSLKK